MYQESYPIVKKTLRKIILFYGKQEQYCLYEEKNDTYYRCESDYCDFILWIGLLCDGKNSISNISELSKYEKKKYEPMDAILILFKLNAIENLEYCCNNFNEMQLFSKPIYTKEFDSPPKKNKKLCLLYWSILLFGLIVSVLLLFMSNQPLVFIFKNNMVYKNLIIYYILSIVLTCPLLVIHELAHITMGAAFGLKVKYFKIALYLYLFPVFYVKINGIYALKPRQRILVLLAGIISHVILVLIFYNFFLATRNNLFLAVAFANFQLVLVNLLPLKLSDGYFVLINILKEINLRKALFIFLKNPNKTIWKGMSTKQRWYSIISLLCMYIYIYIQIGILVVLLIPEDNNLFIVIMVICSNIIFILYLFVIRFRMKAC